MTQRTGNYLRNLAGFLIGSVVLLAAPLSASNIFAAPDTSTKFIASDPKHGAVIGDIRPTLRMRYSGALRASSISAETVTVLGPSGTIDLNVSLDRSATAVLISPAVDLIPGTLYTAFIRGVQDASGHSVGVHSIQFRTASLRSGSRPSRLPQMALTAPASSAGSATNSDPEIWLPGPAQASGHWTVNGAPSYDRTQQNRWSEEIPPLRAGADQTAISGHVARINGRPLSNVSVSVGSISSRSDEHGRFLIAGLQPGHHVLTIDASNPGLGNANYGEYLVRVHAIAGKTTVIPETFWLNKLDPRGTVDLPSPTTRETVVRSPSIPGLELRIPAGSVIRDRKGNVLTRINITPVPIDRPPFPLPGFDVPVYFTIQPGGAWIQGAASGSASAARLIYPNSTSEIGGARTSFWNYDPQEKEWYVYGLGTVGSDRRQVLPDAGVGIYQFSGAMINSPGLTPPATGPSPGCGVGDTGPAPDVTPRPPGDGDSPPDGTPPPPKSPAPESDCLNAAGDPVDAATGLFVLENSDLFLPDTWSIELLRTYRQGDSNSRPFGVGTTHPFEMFIWSANQYQELDLVLPNGSRVHYVRTSPGTGFTDAEFEHTSSPTKFYKSTVKWNGNGWDLRLKDGTVYVYGDTRPLQLAI